MRCLARVVSRSWYCFEDVLVAKCRISWTKGANRPHDGQIDIYEHWNEAPHNQPALHTGLTSDVGECLIDNVNQTATVASVNCDNNFEDPPKQGKGSGCSVVDTEGPWANEDGGVCK